MAMMEHEDISNENLAGHLLVAAPYLDGAGFHHSVIFLSRAEKEFVIRHTEIPESLYAVPIFKGGPVERNQLIFAAFIRTEDKLRVQFHLQEEQALEYLEDPRAILRAYVGHSGWTPPQLRRELNDRAWYVSPMVPDICLETDSSKVWAMAMRRLSPLHHIMSHASAQPSLN